ncbi:MAG: adenylate/guanylate cyclase domain-containing protein [Rhodobacteraceae bacterium]|nr:adenylate/guanylate cyclase domain-containing protein [Paracoccaceae bacterium]
MGDGKPDRKLTAILAADVVGYSKLMGEDDAGTLAEYSRLKKDLIHPLIADHQGRVVNIVGDATLAEFPSVVDAVACAQAWHRSIADNADAKIGFRIGVNLGDVLVEDGQLFGNGVNVAARLEGLALSGGTCISGTVYNEVKNKTDLQFEDMGEHEVKNIAEPIRVYKILTDAPSAKASLAIPEKPSIAVLPFDNMSGDPEQEYLADGITEDLITALSKIRWFFVIARNSTFTYKGQAVDVTTVAKDLGVRYVLEGSVRKAGSRVRITAQLIDASNGHHVWAERYDRQMEDIFDLQDEMTQTIIGAVEPEISAAERARVSAKKPDNLDAWESYQRGVWHMWTYKRDHHENALKFLLRASELDPNFAPAHAYRSYVYYQRVMMAWTKDRKETLDLGMEAARKALANDKRDAVAYFAIGRIHMMQGSLDDSIAALQASVNLNPSFAQAHHGLGFALCLAGRFEEAKKANAMCERLSPRDPIIWGSLTVQTLTRILAKEYEEAVEWALKTQQCPEAAGYWPHAVMAAPLAHLGRIEEAKKEVQKLLALVPDMTLSDLADTYATKHPDGLKPYLDGLRMAGLPE